MNRLEDSSLLQFMTSTGWKFSWDFQNEKPGDDAQMPQLESLESYILNLRLFIQNKEPISLRNMAALYKAECKSPSLLQQFIEVHEAFNHALDQNVWFKFNGQEITYRALFDGMIYSEFAHTNKAGHALFQQIIVHPFGDMAAMNEFLKCIAIAHTCLVRIKALNREAFSEGAIG